MERFNIPIQPSKCTTFKHPEIVGIYAMNDKREWQKNVDPFLKVYDAKYWEKQCLKKTPLDLRRGRVILGGDNYYSEGITPLLRWIYYESEWARSDFVLSRGSLSKLMRTPYEDREPWRFSVTKYEGTIYIKPEETEYERIREDRCLKTMKHLFEWGHKFEHLLTQTSTFHLNNDVNTNQQKHGVYLRNIGGYNLLYGAEIDAIMVDRTTSLRPIDCIEFKVNREIVHTKHHELFPSKKLLKWWAQSYLVGIPTIVCGFRDDHGVVRRIENFSVHELPKGMEWRPKVCKTFLTSLLKLLRNEMIVRSNVVYSISWKPPGTVVNVYETKQLLSHILPSWYILKRNFDG